MAAGNLHNFGVNSHMLAIQTVIMTLLLKDLVNKKGIPITVHRHFHLQTVIKYFDMIYKSFSKKTVDVKFEDIDLSKNDPDQCYYYIGYRKYVKGKNRFSDQKVLQVAWREGGNKEYEVLAYFILKSSRWHAISNMIHGQEGLCVRV